MWRPEVHLKNFHLSEFIRRINGGQERMARIKKSERWSKYWWCPDNTGETKEWTGQKHIDPRTQENQLFLNKTYRKRSGAEKRTIGR